MEEEKKEPLTLKSFMEQMYGVKLTDPTPEELEEVGRFLEFDRERRREARKQRDGQKDA